METLNRSMTKMISEKEMFCTVFGAMTFNQELEPKIKTELLYKLGTELLGFTKDEVKTIIEELDKNLVYLIEKTEKLKSLNHTEDWR